MKKIRRTRITVRKREVLVVKNNDNSRHFENPEPHICPLCHSPLHSKLTALTECDQRLLAGSQDSLTEQD